MHIKILNKLHPRRTEHNHDKSERRKEYNWSPNLIVCPHLRVGRSKRAFPHSENKFKDHWKKKKTKQQTLHKIKRPFVIQQEYLQSIWSLKETYLYDNIYLTCITSILYNIWFNARDLFQQSYKNKMQVYSQSFYR